MNTPLDLDELREAVQTVMVRSNPEIGLVGSFVMVVEHLVEGGVNTSVVIACSSPAQAIGLFSYGGLEAQRRVVAAMEGRDG